MRGSGDTKMGVIAEFFSAEYQNQNFGWEQKNRFASVKILELLKSQQEHHSNFCWVPDYTPAFIVPGAAL